MILPNVLLCNYHHNHNTEHFYHPQKFLNLLCNRIVLPFLGFHIFCTLCIWLLSLRMFLKFIHVVASICTLFFFLLSNVLLFSYNITWLHIYQTMNISILSSFLALKTIVSRSIHVHIFVWIYIFLLGKKPNSGVSGTYGKWNHNIIRNSQNVFQSDLPFCILTSNGWASVQNIFLQHLFCQSFSF